MYDQIEPGIIMNCVYVPCEKLEASAYVYVRFVRGEELGFSVMDDITTRPDYSQCSVFWMKQGDFLKMFRPCETNDIEMQ